MFFTLRFVMPLLAVLWWATPVSALRLCARLDDSGDIRDGASIKLRSECKRNDDGTLREIAIGTSDQLVTLEARLALAATVRDRKDGAAQLRAARNEITGRLSEIYATGSTRSVTVDPTEAVAALDSMQGQVPGLLAELTPFDLPTPPAPEFEDEVLGAVQALNALIAELAELGDVMQARLATAKATALAHQRTGTPLPFSYTDNAIVASLHDAQTVLDCERRTAGNCIATEAALDDLQAALRAALDGPCTEAATCAVTADGSQLATTDFQNILQKRNQVLESISKIMEILHDESMAIVRSFCRDGNC